MIRRRDFIALLSGAAAWPLAARAQQPAMPVIGFLRSASLIDVPHFVAAFRRGLKEAGYVEGQNVAIEFRSAENQPDRLPALVADLLGRPVAVIVGDNVSALAAKTATKTIPIVFAGGGDPVQEGLVASLNRPGGNVTGITSLNADIAAKRLGVLRELVPQATRYFTLVNPTSQLAEPFIKDLQAGAASLGTHIDILHASTDGEIEAAFADLPLAVTVAARHAVPTMFDGRDYVDAGGLASYGADFVNVMELAGNYTARILKGEKPADLPVVQAAKFELVINLKTAKALGVTVPPTLLAIADEVIE